MNVHCGQVLLLNISISEKEMSLQNAGADYVTIYKWPWLTSYKILSLLRETNGMKTISVPTFN
jgi:hypothetical protein